MKKTNFKAYEAAILFHQRANELKAKAFLKDQLERASLSVVLNLAEGAAKPSPKEKKKFYSIAYGSIRECQAILRVLSQASLFKEADAIGGQVYKLIQNT